MSTFTVQLTKTIVVHIEADSEEEMRERVSSTEVGENFDGAFDNVEPSIEVLDVEDDDDGSTPPGDAGALLIGGSDDEEVEPCEGELAGPTFNPGDAVEWDGQHATVRTVEHFATATNDWWYSINVEGRTGAELVGQSDLSRSAR